MGALSFFLACAGAPRRLGPRILTDGLLVDPKLKYDAAVTLRDSLDRIGRWPRACRRGAVQSRGPCQPRPAVPPLSPPAGSWPSQPRASLLAADFLAQKREFPRARRRGGHARRRRCTNGYIRERASRGPSASERAGGRAGERALAPVTRESVPVTAPIRAYRRARQSYWDTGGYLRKRTS